MAYTPEGSLLPNCGNSLDAVIKDIQLISQLTTRIRLYGADCNQSALVLEAIKQTGVDMEVFLGNYVLPDEPTAYTRQRDTLREAIETYGTDHIEGITVGNEFMLNYLDGLTDPNSATGATGAALLIADIEDTRDMLTSMNLPKTILVGNSDAGSYFNTEVLSAIDYGLSNVHAWFANTTAAAAADWVFTFFDETNVQPALALPNKPTMYIAETGWPTASSDLANANNGPSGSPADLAGLQTFLDTFVCQANANNVGYFFFEFFDEEWKDIEFGGVEGHWGLFTKERELKDVIIPDCPSP
jgi:exo-beta-1,3-glucanase (GH17 family)